MKTLHHAAFKPNKKAAYQLAEKLFHGDELTDKEKSTLLLYFAPATPKKAKTNIDFIKQAVAKNDCRYYLNYIRVYKGVASGCNGHILHQCTTDLNDGAYCPGTDKPVDEDIAGKYPDIEQIKPKLDESQRINWNSATIERITTSRHGATTLVNDWPFDTKYVDQLKYLIDDDIKHDVYLITDLSKPRAGAKLVVKTCNCYALVCGRSKEN